MKKIIFILFAVIFLVGFNFNIWKKQQLIQHGDILLLELGPVDPRSFMTGDYMRLRFAIEEKVKTEGIQDKGHIVIAPNKNNVGVFNRFYDGKTLGQNEKLMKYKKEYESIHLKPDSFFFQKGHAKFYEKAKYGVYKCDSSGTCLLVDLADEKRQIIKPE